MEFLLPLCAFAIPAAAGGLAVRRGAGWIVPVLIAGFAGLMGWAIWRGRQEVGWDGLGYVILAVLVAAPAILGSGLGGAVGWGLNRRDRRAARRGGR